MITYKESTGNEELKAKKTTAPLRSEDYVIQSMPPLLGTIDMTTIYLATIFFIVNATTAAAGGVSTLTYWLVAGVAFLIPTGIATAQLAVMFPREGGLYNWTYKSFGNFWSFFASFCSWLPGVLMIISASSTILGFIQALNKGWQLAPWEQGILILVIIIGSGFIATRRFRRIQNVVNFAVYLSIIGVILLGLASLFWLWQGKIAAVPFNNINYWMLSPNNFSIFGLIVFTYMGVAVPMQLGGEVIEKRAITRHLIWGSLFAIAGSLIISFSVLVLFGSNVSDDPFTALFSTFNKGLGSIAGTVASVFILCFLLVVPVVYNYAFARILMVGGIDHRIPTRLSHLNKNRIPSSAITFQTVIAAFLAAMIYFVIPFLSNNGTGTIFAQVTHSITQAAATLVWAMATLFLFANLFFYLTRGRKQLEKHRLFPGPVLWLSAIGGTVVCLAAVVNTFSYSWVPDMISNSQWWFIVGAISLLGLMIGGVASMFANSQAVWQEINKPT